ncbi:toxin-antitoxin system YwqK family antitoxin [Chryseobacterium turcicum]|uniref:Uncharacterized protein n=1 Tax=Chryseobacterium turcicum TaxID=2898076 RepID=A0A9Q3UXW8_9FLAO|nr:hypothetical protein [Chryseobacterium turcicum]MCD1115269.1 hypothetical protein [Chryseobacterium turcicum]
MVLKQPQKIRVNFDSLEYVSNTSQEILGYNGQLFTGYAVLDYFADRNVSYEKEYRDGEVMGWINEYYPNGNLMSEKLCVWDSRNSILLNEYDQTGNLIKSMKMLTQEMYNESVNKFNLLV